MLIGCFSRGALKSVKVHGARGSWNSQHNQSLHLDNEVLADQRSAPRLADT